jgi:hypothetical protein
MKLKNKLIFFIFVISSLSLNFINSKIHNKQERSEITFLTDEYISQKLNFNKYNVYISNVNSREIKIVKSDKYDLDEAIAYAEFDKKLYKNGWDFLRISSNSLTKNKYDDQLIAYSAGYLEGYITYKKILMHYKNMKQYIFPVQVYTNSSMPENVKQYLKENNEWIRNKTKENKDEYWYNVNLIQEQYEGMVDGFNKKIKEKFNHSQDLKEKLLSYEDFQVMNAFGDLFDIPSYKSDKKIEYAKFSYKKIIKYIKRHTHCSSIIKLKPDYSDIFFAHNTWFSYLTMTRIFKEYKLSFKDSVSSVAFSGYPGTLSSVDDFYVTSNLLYVAETTNPTFNSEFGNLLSPKSLLTWMRSILANRIAKDAKTWTEIFIKNNSGTYNNQFMIVDLKKVNLEKKILEKDAFWIIEQIPGFYKSQDMSDYLIQNLYWASYNAAYFEEIREKSKYDEMIKAQPELTDQIDHEKCVRAQIFKREQVKINSLNDLKKLMRCNDYKNDPLSKNDPDLAISSREDLDENKHTCEGALDAKITSYTEILQNKKIHIISGPTTDIQPPFRPKETVCNKKGELKFYGLAEIYDYPWIEFTPYYI